MTFSLRNLTIEEKGIVIRFLTAEGLNEPADIRLLTESGGDCVPEKSVRKSCARFYEVLACLGDDQSQTWPNLLTR